MFMGFRSGLENGCISVDLNFVIFVLCVYVIVKKGFFGDCGCSFLKKKEKKFG